MKTYDTRNCLYCGPYKVIRHPVQFPDAIPCPTCGLDPMEVRMIEKVVKHGFEACYRSEFNGVS